VTQSPTQHSHRIILYAMAKLGRIDPDREIRAVLLDITGVLVESSAKGDGVAVQGSVDAVRKLTETGNEGPTHYTMTHIFVLEGVPFRLVTNETQKTRAALVAKLTRLGFNVPEEKVFTPALAMAAIIRQKKLRPLFLAHPNCLPDLGDSVLGDGHDSVVLGDAVKGFSYENMNKAFRILKSTGGPLYSLGKGKYYAEDGELTLDVGPFTAALEYANDVKAIIVGKPSADFFGAALDDMGVSAADAVMVGDDVASDVGGAQACGAQGVLVRSGKYRPEDERRPDVKPDAVYDRLELFVERLLKKE